MTDIIAALRDEIAAAERKRESASVWVSRHVREQIEFGYTRYIDGLQTAVDLLTREPALPFTEENGDCSFAENGDLL